MLDQEELKYIASTYQTPCFIFDEEALIERVKEIRKISEGKYHLCYSIKANPFLIPTMIQLVDHLEVCSPGELQICKALHVPGDMIIYSGVNKEACDIDEAIQYGVDVLTCESLKHVKCINEEAKKLNATVPVLLRLNAGSQFGMSKKDLFSVIDQMDVYSNIQVKGIHYFVGTQRKKIEHKVKELEMLKTLFQEIEAEHHVKLDKLEYGPGCNVSLFENEDFTDTYKPLKEIHTELSSFVQDVTIEMGRFFATYCGTYLTKVMDLKENKGVNYCIVDGGINHVNYYGSMMGMNVPVTQHITDMAVEAKDWCICGSLCSTNDILIRKYHKGLSEGDLIAFENIGAYSVTEGINLFLSRTLPCILLRKKKYDYEVQRGHVESYVLNIPGGRKNG